MPKYTIQGPDGRTVTVEGDKPPTEQEMRQIFAALPAPQQQNTQPSGQSSAEQFMGRASTAMQGATFGLADEGMRLFANAMQPGSGDVIRNLDNQNRQQFAQENPGEALGLEVAGGLATGGYGAAKVGARFMQNAPSIMRGAAAGAGGGGLYGAGAADEGERLSGAAQGAALGAAVGAALPVVAPVARKVGSWFESAYSAATRGPEKRAVERIVKAFADDGVTPQQARDNLAEMTQGATVMDAGGANVRGLVEQGAQTPGPARRIAEERLLERNQNLPENLRAGVARLNANVDNFASERAAIVSRRQAEAQPLYEIAYSSPLNNASDELQFLARLPVVKSQFKGALERVQSDVRLPESVRSAATADNPGLAVWDAVKKRFDDQIGEAKRAGRNNEASELTALNERLRKELDSQVPEYGAARRIWESDSKAIGALDRGLDFFTVGKKAPTIAEYRAMSGTEQELFRLGAARAMQDVVNSTGRNLSDELSPGVFNKLFGSDSRRSWVNEVFGADNAEEFSRLLKSEKQFRANANEALRGSPTARREGQMSDAADAAGMFADVAGATAGNPVQAAGVVSRILSRFGKRSNPAVDEAVTDMLTSADADMIKQVLNQIENPPGWANGVRKMTPTQMGKWLSNPKNRQELQTAISGGGGTASVSATSGG